MPPRPHVVADMTIAVENVVTHVPPEQQPGQWAGSHTQWPAVQFEPSPQAASAPQKQLPPPQVSAAAPLQVRPPQTKSVPSV
jgi:hypothetical protein